MKRISAFRFLAMGAIFGGLGFPLEAKTTGFESGEGFEAGVDIAIQSGWKGSTPGLGTVFTGSANTGSQSLKIGSSTEEAFVRKNATLSGQDVIFIDFWIRPCADSSETPASTVDANGAALAFLKESDRGRIYVAPASGSEEAVETGFDFEIDDANLARDWIRVTLRQDREAKTWDLFLDGKLTLVDQPLSDSTLRGKKKIAFAVYGTPAGDAYVDDIAIDSSNPLFPDADADGIPDAVEEVEGTNPYFNDRSYDRNLDGASNITNFLRRESMVLSSNSEHRFIFIDSANGSDSASGEFSYPVNKMGPKRSLKAAQALKDENIVLVLMPSDVPYVCPDYPDGKEPNFTYYLIGNASLTGE